jgi:hypothetical protein
MRSVTPRLVAAIAIGDLYTADTPAWSSPEAQAAAQRLIDRANLASAGVGYKQYLFDRYVDNLEFEQIAAKYGENREWAPSASPGLSVSPAANSCPTWPTSAPPSNESEKPLIFVRGFSLDTWPFLKINGQTPHIMKKLVLGIVPMAYIQINDYRLYYS